MPILNNAVPMAVHNQIRWERDQAMQQLKDHGIPFGGVAPDVVEVVRCGECKCWNACSFGRFMLGENGFCSYGERWSNNGEIQKETR